MSSACTGVWLQKTGSGDDVDLASHDFVHHDCLLYIASLFEGCKLQVFQDGCGAGLCTEVLHNSACRPALYLFQGV